MSDLKLIGEKIIQTLNALLLKLGNYEQINNVLNYVIIASMIVAVLSMALVFCSYIKGVSFSKACRFFKYVVFGMMTISLLVKSTYFVLDTAIDDGIARVSPSTLIMTAISFVLCLFTFEKNKRQGEELE